MSGADISASRAIRSRHQSVMPVSKLAEHAAADSHNPDEIECRHQPAGGTTMFSELVESTPRASDKRKKLAVITSLASQAACLLTLIVIPLVYTQALPKVIFKSTLVLPKEPAAQPPTPTAPPNGKPHSVRLLRDNVLTEPVRIPTRVRIFREAELPPELAVAPGIGDAPMVNLFNLAAAPAVAVNRPAEPVVPRRVQLGGKVEDAKLISRIQPVYPAPAIQVRIQGDVILHAIIGKEGDVNELQVISGHPFLVRAALDAVRQWRYRPTLLNGLPVEVETTITVSFVLGQ
jgi:periplasmic protein TonB